LKARLSGPFSLAMNKGFGMTEPISSAASGIAAAQAMGMKAGAGIVGAALLYMVLPPGRPQDKPTSRAELGREIAVRVAFAGITSAAFGDWLIDLVNAMAPWLLAAKHPTPFLIAAGAVGWYIGRAVALWLYRRQDKDAGEVLDELNRRN
jgi:hypothetical protein